LLVENYFQTPSLALWATENFWKGSFSSERGKPYKSIQIILLLFAGSMYVLREATLALATGGNAPSPGLCFVMYVSDVMNFTNRNISDVMIMILWITNGTHGSPKSGGELDFNLATLEINLGSSFMEAVQIDLHVRLTFTYSTAP